MSNMSNLSPTFLWNNNYVDIFSFRDIILPKNRPIYQLKGKRYKLAVKFLESQVLG